MANTEICTNATANGFVPSSSGITPGATEKTLMAHGFFAPGVMEMQASIDGGSNWIPMPGGLINGPAMFNFKVGADVKIRGEIKGVGPSTSISAFID